MERQIELLNSLELPTLYASSGRHWEDVLIHERLFLGASEWYVAEHSPHVGVLYGFAIIENDVDNGEWGNFYVDDLASLTKNGVHINRDPSWRTVRAGDVSRIRLAMVARHRPTPIDHVRTTSRTS